MEKTKGLLGTADLMLLLSGRLGGRKRRGENWKGGWESAVQGRGLVKGGYGLNQVGRSGERKGGKKGACLRNINTCRYNLYNYLATSFRTNMILTVLKLCARTHL